MINLNHKNIKGLCFLVISFKTSFWQSLDSFSCTLIMCLIWTRLCVKPITYRCICLFPGDSNHPSICTRSFLYYLCILPCMMGFPHDSHKCMYRLKLRIRRYLFRKIRKGILSLYGGSQNTVSKWILIHKKGSSRHHHAALWNYNTK